MAQRKERADALRNRESVLAAADALFTRSGNPHSVSMDDVAAAAGVGKGTLFRRFGDRAGLIAAVIGARLEPLLERVREEGNAGDGGREGDTAGSALPPRQRVRSLLDTVLRFKIENRHLMSVAEDAGISSPYQAEHYVRWHETLCETVRQVSGVSHPDFTAHALLSTVRADLVTHLVDGLGMPQDELRAALAAHVDALLGPDTEGADSENLDSEGADP
ncbi:TetR/AcrR family transcriptional regulator [Streptomyces sp. NBC_01795]|uniref:TetR/AcrR family transcriptional regulator n=1 Tax=unclassified Streptomyces TaxID=2593676 RepID=UPI002DD7C705|nr:MULTISPECIES: TetR/AcrR family transcriptional regulator [unclassified Streptomyces]WSA91715.1 TetR/AcrR family transcriptional regulator [Streptomyces sp. NBC_01795]WSB76087.1 TetR/AcrR family transcriptional regulator [Streptomyces sp. NBC_01775]WSS15639.1 TetR/AcrR family transcriptional regulator [Streptomyces sp. NBC_01186]